MMEHRLWRTGLESTLVADRFDLVDWRDASTAIPQIASINARAGREFCGHPVQDGFFSLFKRVPHLADPIPAGLEPLADLIRRGMETPQWERLRETSTGDLVASGVGAVAFVEEVLKSLPEEIKEQAREHAQASQRALEDQRKAQALQDLAEMLRERAGQQNDGEAAALEAQAEAVSEQASELYAEAQAAQEQAAQALANYQAGAEANAPQIQAALNQAAAQAQAQAADASEAARGFALAAGGDPAHIDPATAREAMEALRRNPNLDRLAELLGWARRVARAEWRKSPRARTEMVGYRVHDLRPEGMAPVEWAGLLAGDKTLEADWMRRAADGGIRHRHFEGEQEQGKGPLVIVRDESGSMGGAAHALAVAVEWALLEIARRDGRDFYSIPFSGQGQYAVWQAPRSGQPDGASLLEHLAHFYGGGTEPYRPLAQAVNLVQGADLRADILLITDAVFAVPPREFLERLGQVRQQRPLRIETVVIGADNPAALTFSDRVTCVDDLLRDREQLRGAIGGVV